MIWPSSYTKIALTVAGLGLGALALNAYTAHVKADAQAQATIKAEETVQKGLQEQLNALEKALADRDLQYKEQLNSLQLRLSQAQSPQQIATLVSQVMGLKQPIQITTPVPTQQNPNPTPIAEVSTLDAPQVKAYIQECETCKLQVPKLQADLSDRMAQQAIAEKEIQSLKTQNQALTVMAKGSKWSRIWNHPAVKVIIFAGGVYLGHRIK